FTIWRELAPYPKLVSDVNLVAAASAPVPLRFNTRIGIPGQPRLQIGMDLVETPDGRNVALIVPLIPGHRAMAVGESDSVARIMTVPSPPGVAQIVFDRNYIERHFIPELVDRAFAERRVDLQILIARNGEPSRAIRRAETAS